LCCLILIVSSILLVTLRDYQSRISQLAAVWRSRGPIRNIEHKKCWVGTTHCQLGKARRNYGVVFGGRSTRLLRGHNSLRTDRRATSTYRTIDCHELRTSMLATTRSLVSKLATAHVFCSPTANQHVLFSSAALIFRFPTT